MFNSRHDFGVLDESDAKGHDGDDERHGCKRRYDLQVVAAHEIGHFFGLGEDDDEPSSTMFKNIQRYQTKKRSLSELDRAALVELYAEPLPIDEAPAPGAGCAAAPNAERRSGWVVALGLLVFARRRAHGP